MILLILNFWAEQQENIVFLEKASEPYTINVSRLISENTCVGISIPCAKARSTVTIKVRWRPFRRPFFIGTAKMKHGDPFS
ncbi:hypothetical protein AL546_016005 [Vibrio vulnificus]|nr:hypothetical protein AL546_016005 [Vibrio vulnificus]HAS8248685.1 hypothetical protein [Vibrio vulnificus]